MKAKDVRNMLMETGIPVAYQNWSGNDGSEPPPLPYLVYYAEGETTLYADDGNYTDQTQWCLELYVECKTEQLEAEIESVLSSREIPFLKNEVGPVSQGAPLLITYRFQTI